MTPFELRQAALRETGIGGMLATAEPEQDQLAVEKYAGLHGQLRRDGLATWAEDEDVPAGAQQAMVYLLANALAKPMGAPDEEVIRLSQLGSYGADRTSLGERMLLKYVASRYVSQPATAEYF